MKAVRWMIVVMGLVLVTVTAMGQEGEESIFTGTMEINCEALSAEALKYVQSQGFCVVTSDVQPMENIRSGSCGNTQLFMSGSGGLTGFDFAVRSNHGPITVLNYNIVWNNWSSQRSGGFGNPAVAVNAQWWESFEAVNTGRGTITGSMTGSAWVWFGPITIQCIFLIPTDDIFNN